MKNTLLELIDKVFSENGSIVQLGGRYSSQQHQYAKHVALSLVDGDKVSFLEAETGIGKSLGYIIPILLLQYLKKKSGAETKPIAISTFTRQLQKQIFNKDTLFAQKALKEIEIDTSEIHIAYRMGRTSFFSISRTQIACENLVFEQPERKSELSHFFKYVIDSCENGAGLLSDWLEEYGSFPDGIKTKDICLLSRQKVDNEAYKYHLQQAKDADCLITNHATLINFKQVGIAPKTFSAIIFDEAHKIETICQDHFNYHSSFKELVRNIAHTVELFPQVKELKQSISLLDELSDSVITKHHSDKENYITKINAPTEMDSYFHIIEKTNSYLKKASKKIDKYVDHGEIDAATATILSNYEKSVNIINHWKPVQAVPHIISAIHFSPVIRKLSLATINIFASRLVSWMCNEMADTAVFTSATMSDTKRDISFKTISNSLGFKEENIGQQCSLSPSQYGHMDFVLTQKKINSPILEISEEQTEFAPDWLNNVVGMIEAAHKQGGAVLCLTTSHYETKVIAAALSALSLPVLYHKKNTAMNEYLSDFINGNSSIFITSAGWEGLDVRKPDGSQLIKHVIISRIPYSPPNELLEYFYKEYSKYKMKEAQYQTRLSWLIQVTTVVPKLKQGLGRGIRAPHDKVKIWFADPRMPHSNNDRVNNTLLYAIPKRFMNNYLNAEVFGEEKREIFMI